MQSAFESALALIAFTWLAHWAARNAHIVVRWCLPVTLALDAVVVATSAWFASLGPLPAAAPIVLALSAVDAIADIQTGFIFDSVQIAAVIVIGICSYGRLVDMLAGGATGFALLIVPYAVTRGTGLGFGDVKFAAVLGSALGVNATVTAVFVAFVSAGAAATVMISTRRARRTSSLAFAPFLSFGAAWALGLSVVR